MGGSYPWWLTLSDHYVPRFFAPSWQKQESLWKSPQASSLTSPPSIASMDSSSCLSCRQGSQKNGECGLQHPGNEGVASPREFGFNRVDSWVSWWFCHSVLFVCLFLIFFAKRPLSLEFLWSKARQELRPVSRCPALLPKVPDQSWLHRLHCYLVSPSLIFFTCKLKGL